MDKEHIDEIKREEAREIREEPMYIWIEEEKSNLMKEFIEAGGLNDDFIEFCKKIYKEEVD